MADEQIASGRFASLGEYLAALIREDRSRASDQEIRDVLRQRLQSGPPQEMTDSDFDRIRRRLEIRTR